ncbi:MAG: hypothetical protein SFV22_07705 [Saprospiraceae bacterium]|nr:hypothetical protein [Saprospiraceae bacterium]
MKFVSETVIDAIVDKLEELPDTQYEKQMSAFAEAQPVLFSWLFSDAFELLTDDEKGYLQYLALITWLSVVEVNGPVEAVSEEQIGEAEEQNYAVLESSTAKKFRDRLNPFFEDTDQEDLLAFAEDAVSEGDDDPESLVTREGREPIFVALKTMVDVLTGNDHDA